jgi:hypothetical protein
MLLLLHRAGMHPLLLMLLLLLVLLLRQGGLLVMRSMHVLVFAPGVLTHKPTAVAEANPHLNQEHTAFAHRTTYKNEICLFAASKR